MVRVHHAQWRWFAEAFSVGCVYVCVCLSWLCVWTGKCMCASGWVSVCVCVRPDGKGSVYVVRMGKGVSMS